MINHHIRKTILNEGQCNLLFIINIRTANILFNITI